MDIQITDLSLEPRTEKKDPEDLFYPEGKKAEKLS